MSTVSKSATWNLRSKKNNIRFHKDLDSILCLTPPLPRCENLVISRVVSQFSTNSKVMTLLELKPSIWRHLEYLGVFYVKHLGYFQRDLIRTYHTVKLFIQVTNPGKKDDTFFQCKFLWDKSCYISNCLHFLVQVKNQFGKFLFDHKPPLHCTVWIWCQITKPEDDLLDAFFKCC